MTNVNFLTALKYDFQKQTCCQSLKEKVDGYFYLGGRRAKVLQNQSRDRAEIAVMIESNVSRLTQVALIMSYLTVFIPFILFLLKLAFRLPHKVRLIEPGGKDPLKANGLFQFQKFAVVNPVQPNPLLQEPSVASVLLPASLSPINSLSTPLTTQSYGTPSKTNPKIISSEFYTLNPNDQKVVNDPYVKALLNKVESYKGRKNILSFTVFDTFAGTKIRIANCVRGCTLEIGNDLDRTLLINGQQVGFAHLDEDCYVLAFEEKGEICLYYWEDNESLNDENVVVRIAKGKPIETNVSGNIFP